MLIANAEFEGIELPVADVADDALATMRGLLNCVVLSAACWTGILVVGFLLF